MFIFFACSSDLETIKADEEVNYTFYFGTETRSEPLTPDEKKIESLFVAIYDETGQMIECKVTKDDSPVTFKVSVLKKVDHVFVIANVLSNSDYSYTYNNETVNFDADMSSLKGQLPDFQNMKQIAVRHKTNADHVFVITKQTPLPMFGNAPVVSNGTTIVRLQMSVARVDVINSLMSSTINSISFRHLVNHANLTPESGLSSVSSDAKILFSPAVKQKRYTFYIPSNHSTEKVSVVIEFTDLNNKKTTVEENFARLSGGKYYTASTNEVGTLSINPVTMRFEASGGNKQLTVTSNTEWEIVGCRLFTVSSSQGSGQATITVSAPPNYTTSVLSETIVVRQIGTNSVSAALVVTQNAGKERDYIFNPDVSELSFESSGSAKTIMIDRAEGMAETSVRNVPDWVAVTRSVSGKRDTYVFTTGVNMGAVRNSSVIFMGGTTQIKTLAIEQKERTLSKTITFKVDNVNLGSALNADSKGKRYALYMTESPKPTNEIIVCKARNANGSSGSWWRLDNEYSSVKDEIWHEKDNVKLVVDENFGDERSVDIEFYDMYQPADVYKRFKIVQRASSNYLTLSSSDMSLDKWGNVYQYVPYELNVSSNLNWTIEKSADADWVTLSYIPNKSQTVKIRVDEGNTERTAVLKFVSNGIVMKEFTIRQRATQDASFDVRYRLNLDCSTTNNKFKSEGSYGTYYVSTIEIFDNYAPTGADYAAKFTQNWQYGYVTDAPGSFNQMVASNLDSDYFRVKNYRRSATSRSGNSTVLAGINSFSFFRQITYTLPIPANVNPDEIIVFDVVIKNIQGTAVYDPAVITHQIEKLTPQRF